jgi:tetraacyldisaccharide 4'-kinase
MREPAFWWRDASWQSSLLAPLGTIYGWMSARRMVKPGARANIPVICVGNYHVGGAGKTPTVIALVAMLMRMGEKPFVLSRGYGGSLSGPVLVDPDVHNASDVGDEPLLLSEHAPVVVARDRAAGADAAQAGGATVIVMDDGFQNPSLEKDLSIIVIDANRGTGNGAVFPAGPLRAPLPVQFPRTDILLIIGEGNAADAVASEVCARGRHMSGAHITPEPDAVASLAGKRVLAFAGIGDPERFFRTLRTAQIDVISTRAFADHHPYSRAEIDDLKTEAREKRLTLVTTEKDRMRLQNLKGGGELQMATLPITLEIQDSAVFFDLVQRALIRRRSGSF